MCERSRKSDHQKSRGKYVEIFLAWERFELVGLCKTAATAVTREPVAHCGTHSGHQPSALPSASDSGTGRGCQEASCPPSLSSFDPHSFLFLLWPLKPLRFGQLLSLAALVCCARGEALPAKGGERRGQGGLPALPCVAAPWLVDRE